MTTCARLCRTSSWALILLLLAACSSPTTTEDGYAIPMQTGDGWQTASLESVGMDPEPLLALQALISNTPQHLMHGLVIVRDGMLVFEEYWPGTDLEPVTLNPVPQNFNRETLHYVASVSKSLTSALAGVALEQGLISGVDDPLFSFFPEYDALKNEENDQITLRHLLSFSSGLDWNEFDYDFGDERDSHFQMFAADDPMLFLLGRAVVDPPGSRFDYNSGDTNLVGEIIRKRTGAAFLVDYADEQLFSPLGIVSYEWWRFPRADQVTFASGGAFLRPRDMAKFGQLYLRRGSWDGMQVVPASWVDASTTMSMPLPNYSTVYGYGYNWWLGRSQFGTGEVDHFRASGWGGQDVYVFPELDLVLVFTAGGYYESMPLDYEDLMEDFILPAIRD